MYDLKDKLEEKKIEKRSLENERKRTVEDIEKLSNDLWSLDRLDILVKKAKTETQAGISEELSEIVSEAMFTVFEEKYEEEKDSVAFKLEFEEETSACRCYFEDSDGDTFPVIGSRGFGFVDIVSVSLRTAFLMFNQSSRPLIVHDEPCRFLSKEYHEFAAEMFRSFSQELGIQYIIMTNEEGLLNSAENVFRVEKRNKKSIVTKE